VARKWKNSSYALRSKLNQLIGQQLDEWLSKSEPDDTVLFFDELRAEMKGKGLTQEILDDILRNE